MVMYSLYTWIVWIPIELGVERSTTKIFIYTLMRKYAGDALLANDGSYIPEFTAVVVTENIRLLQLTRADYFADEGGIEIFVDIISIYVCCYRYIRLYVNIRWATRRYTKA